VRVLIDYRPALRERSGVGEYTHELARALVHGQSAAVELTLFSSSWKDRLRLDGALSAARSIDCRVPVGVLNAAWHRLGWPAAETLTNQDFDVTHSLHPLVLPARRAAQVVTIHDLNFLTHPERTRAEIRRDYPALARKHARRADHIVVVSEFTAAAVEREFGVPRSRMTVCPPGAPRWPEPPHRSPAPHRGERYVLFFGTLEPRKNVGGLLDAYERLVRRRDDLPPLVIAGKATDASGPWLERIERAPLLNRVRHVGYVEPVRRRELYDGARMLVLPSFEEGFGIPVLEAMSLGIPVVVANAGALPEVAGEAGLLVDPNDADSIAGAIERLVDDPALAERCAVLGHAQAARFNWRETAQRMVSAYRQAVDAHRH
jgi:glycosyltransferase involved in cell wall biosynthesis